MRIITVVLFGSLLLLSFNSNTFAQSDDKSPFKGLKSFVVGAETKNNCSDIFVEEYDIEKKSS